MKTIAYIATKSISSIMGSIDRCLILNMAIIKRNCWYVNCMNESAVIRTGVQIREVCE